MSTFSNISSETSGPFEAKFLVEPPWDGGTKVRSNGPGHMTKMAAVPFGLLVYYLPLSITELYVDLKVNVLQYSRSETFISSPEPFCSLMSL